MNVNWRRLFEFTFVMLIVALFVVLALKRVSKAKEASSQFDAVLDLPTTLNRDKPGPR